MTTMVESSTVLGLLACMILQRLSWKESLTHLSELIPSQAWLFQYHNGEYGACLRIVGAREAGTARTCEEQIFPSKLFNGRLIVNGLSPLVTYEQMDSGWTSYPLGNPHAAASLGIGIAE